MYNTNTISEPAPIAPEIVSDPTFDFFSLASICMSWSSLGWLAYLDQPDLHHTRFATRGISRQHACHPRGTDSFCIKSSKCVQARYRIASTSNFSREILCYYTLLVGAASGLVVFLSTTRQIPSAARRRHFVGLVILSLCCYKCVLEYCVSAHWLLAYACWITFNGRYQSDMWKTQKTAGRIWRLIYPACLYSLGSH